MKPIMPIPRLTPEEMREFVSARLACQVMFSSEVHPPSLVSMVFGCGLASDALAPPPELVEEHLGSMSPPDSLPGEPPRPEHPGYPEGPGDPPEKPVLARLPDRVEFDHSWGDLSDEDLKEAQEEIERENKKRIREWEDQSRAWHDAVLADAEARSQVSRQYEAEVEAWQASLSQHEAAVKAREKAREDWHEKFSEVFSEWASEVGVLVGNMKDTFPRALNGYPLFHKFQVLHKEDWVRIEAAIVREQAREIEV